MSSWSSGWNKHPSAAPNEHKLCVWCLLASASLHIFINSSAFLFKKCWKGDSSGQPSISKSKGLDTTELLWEPNPSKSAIRAASLNGAYEFTNCNPQSSAINGESLCTLWLPDHAGSFAPPVDNRLRRGIGSTAGLRITGLTNKIPNLLQQLRLIPVDLLTPGQPWGFFIAKRGSAEGRSLHDRSGSWSQTFGRSPTSEK